MEKISSNVLEGAKKLDTLIELQTMFARKVKLSAIDKVLYSICCDYTTTAQIMARLNISKGNLANYCKKLIEDGLITFTRGKSSRAVKYEATSAGIKFIEDMLSKAM